MAPLLLLLNVVILCWVLVVFGAVPASALGANWRWWTQGALGCLLCLGCGVTISLYRLAMLFPLVTKCFDVQIALAMGLWWAWALAGFCGAFSPPACVGAVGIGAFIFLVSTVDAMALKRHYALVKAAMVGSAFLAIVPLISMTHLGLLREVSYTARTSWGSFETTYADAVTSRGALFLALLARILYHTCRHPNNLGELAVRRTRASARIASHGMASHRRVPGGARGGGQLLH